jgi:hypothetical protein
LITTSSKLMLAASQVVPAERFSGAGPGYIYPDHHPATLTGQTGRPSVGVAPFSGCGIGDDEQTNC